MHYNDPCMYHNLWELKDSANRSVEWRRKKRRETTYVFVYTINMLTSVLGNLYVVTL